MFSRTMLIAAFIAAAPGCLVTSEEPIGLAAEPMESWESATPLTPTDGAIEHAPPEREPQALPVRQALPLSYGAILFAQIGACRHVGSSNAAAITCMLAVLQSMGQ